MPNIVSRLAVLPRPDLLQAIKRLIGYHVLVFGVDGLKGEIVPFAEMVKVKDAWVPREEDITKDSKLLFCFGYDVGDFRQIEYVFPQHTYLIAETDCNI